jgi:hypothetical protein
VIEREREKNKEKMDGKSEKQKGEEISMDRGVVQEKRRN